MHVGSVAARMSLTVDDGTPVIHDDIVIAHTTVFRIETVYDVHDFLGLDDETGLLKDFALDAFDERFAQFEQAARDGLVAFARFVAALYQQHVPASINDNAADADQGVGREFALRQDNSRSLKQLKGRRAWPVQWRSYGGHLFQRRPTGRGSWREVQGGA